MDILDLEEILNWFAKMQEFAKGKDMKAVLLNLKSYTHQYYRVIENIAYVDSIEETIFERKKSKQINLKFANEGFFSIVRPINAEVEHIRAMYAIGFEGNKYSKLFFKELRHFPIITLENITINDERELLNEYIKRAKTGEFTGPRKAEIYSVKKNEKLVRFGTSDFYCALSNTNLN